MTSPLLQFHAGGVHPRIALPVRVFVDDEHAAPCIEPSVDAPGRKFFPVAVDGHGDVCLEFELPHESEAAPIHAVTAAVRPGLVLRVDDREPPLLQFLRNRPGVAKAHENEGFPVLERPGVLTAHRIGVLDELLIRPRIVAAHAKIGQAHRRGVGPPWLDLAHGTGQASRS